MKIKHIAAALLTLGVSFFAFTGVVQAASLKSADRITVDKNETINGSLYAAGDVVVVDGTINGDVLCAGQSITITGTVNGDVLCAGQIIKVSGTVKGDVRVAGQTVTLEGLVAQSVSVLAQTASLGQKSKVVGDLNGAVQTATLDGAIGRDVTLAGETLTINGTVVRDIDVTVEQLALGGGAKVGGHMHYVSFKEAQAAEGAMVKGDTKRTDPPREEKKDKDGFVTTGINWFLLFVMLIGGLVLVALFPQGIHAVSTHAIKRTGRVVLSGLLAALLMPALLITLLLTIIGIPLAAFTGLVWLVIVILAGPLSAYLLGRLLLQKRATNSLLTMLLGSVALFVLYMIPVLNVLTFLTVIVVGAGMILTEITIRYKKPVYKIKREQA